MRIRLSIVILLTGVLCSTCDPYIVSDPCANCFYEKPVEGILEVVVSQLPHQKKIPISIYIGKLENNQLYYRDTMITERAEYWVDMDVRYTVTAEYLVEGKTMVVVDGDRVTATLDSESCDQPCWIPKDGKVNCKLY